MRVAIDATPLSLTSGGLRRYTEELGRALAAEFPDDEFSLVSDQPFAAPEGSPPNLRAGGVAHGLLERRWWSWGVNRAMRRLRADIFHGTDYAVPYVPLRPSVLTLHDLSPWMDPSWHRGAARVRRRCPPLIRLGVATHIVTVSEAVRRDALDLWRIHPSRISAVPLAASHLFRPCPGPPTPRPYFLYVGTLEPRKGVGTLLEAWREVRRRQDVDLVLAGRRREDFGPVTGENGLYWKGEVPDAELPPLYSGAAAFVYPSLYEGFGLPVLEAMQCGACVVTSRDPALRELAGEAALRVDPQDLAGALRAVLDYPEMALEMRGKAVRRAAGFSWGRTARLTWEVYREALRRFAY